MLLAVLSPGVAFLVVGWTFSVDLPMDGLSMNVLVVTVVPFIVVLVVFLTVVRLRISMVVPIGRLTFRKVLRVICTKG